MFSIVAISNTKLKNMIPKRIIYLHWLIYTFTIHIYNGKYVLLLNFHNKFEFLRYSKMGLLIITKFIIRSKYGKQKF